MTYQGIVIAMTKNIAIVSTEDFQCFYIKRNSTFFVGKEVEFTGNEIIGNKLVMLKYVLGSVCIGFLSNFATLMNK